MASEDGGFSLIVSAVDSVNLQEAAQRFAKAFSLDEGIAAQICKSAPIIFAQKLTKVEVKAITPILGDLSKAGLEFRVTARVAAKLPQVNWPVRPQFTAGGSAGMIGLAYEWDNTAFVCPGCGESFLFRRLGKIKLAEAAPKASRPAKAAVAAGFAGEPAPLPEAVGLEGTVPLMGEGESFDLPEAVDEVNVDALLLPDPAPAEVPSPASEPVAAEPEVEEAKKAAAPSDGEIYSVFLSKITDTSKRDKAADLIAKVKGCSADEAKELTTRLIIPLAKNVSKAKAEDILNQFKKQKIFGRMAVSPSPFRPARQIES